MLGDVLLITDNHRKAAEQIVTRLSEFKSDKVVIAIGGESGAGKSELAHVISRRLKEKGELAKILHIDNYYKVSPTERTEWRKKHGIESIGLSEYDWDLINQNIAEFRESKQAVLPCIDLLTDQEDKLVTNFEGIKYLIVEGLYPLKAHADLRIFIDLTYHETKKAQLLRGKEPQNEFRMRVLEREHQAVQSLRPLADLIVTRDFEVVEAKAGHEATSQRGIEEEMTAFDLVLANGRVLDGCGNPWFWGDVAIQGGRIAQVAPADTLRGRETIDVGGRFVAPGFIDVHTHSDLSILVNRRAESAVRQGATTHIIGNCGMSPAPVDEGHLAEMRNFWGRISEQPEVTWEWRTFGQYLQTLEIDGLAINVGSLAGHAALRMAVMGLEPRQPTPAELARMQELLAEAMKAGAFGLSTGLVYPPGCFASTEEIVALCQVVARYHGLYASHIRGERETILEAVAEAIRIGREAGVPVQISHNAPKYGAPCDATANLRLVEEARAQGQDVTVDNDVHTDLGPPLTGGLPQDIQELPVPEIAALLRDPNTRRQIREEIVLDRHPAFGPVGLLKHGQWRRITILHAPRSRDAVGKTIEALARQRNQEPFDVYFDLIVENGHDAEAIFDYIDEANIRLLLQHPVVMICSDGQVLASYGFLNDPPPYSPCSYGEFPGVLERYVRDQPVLTLEEAIRKMTSFPAQRFGLTDRGVLRPGAWADVVVFDLERVRDRATNLYPHTYPFENYPHCYPEGIDYVFANGVLVVEGERHTGALPGQILRHRN